VESFCIPDIGCIRRGGDFMEGLGVIVMVFVVMVIMDDVDKTVKNSHLDEWMYAPEDYPKGKSSSIRR